MILLGNRYRLIIWMLALWLLIPALLHAQVEQRYVRQVDTLITSADIFEGDHPMKITLTLDIKRYQKEKFKGYYMPVHFTYEINDSVEVVKDMRMKARGNFRRSHCNMAPFWLNIKESNIQNVQLQDVNRIKVVTNCNGSKAYDEYVLKEYLAYKLYEHISPYHYKTRLVRLNLLEEKGRRTREHQLLGFFIEDNENLEERLGARKMEQEVHPLYQDALSSTQNNLFEYLIGNTDFSMRHMHNQTLFYVDEKYVCIPYDFDMSGLVNATYSSVSNIQHLKGSIEEVTERIYKGYKRDTIYLQQVRRQFRALKPELTGELELLRPLFGDPGHYREARYFIQVFFEEMESDARFKRQILDRMRED